MTVGRPAVSNRSRANPGPAFHAEAALAQRDVIAGIAALPSASAYIADIGTPGTRAGMPGR
ncbi:hypothetical protein BEN47_03410 [Hymenobacter lapidarius]|uniref:Uncharacterized protein n=1 Tax=Hymenobacter lapidarius TaxID=1908237 RepID=A0A1G1SXK0_9BACT|nr:hypothetical protein BEN47_03410 [Hymenobacter lapidarius]